MASRSLSKSNSIMLVASLAAVYAILRIIPTFPLLGVPGAYFSVSDVIASLYGILLGPYLGPLSIMLGTFIGYFAGKPPVFLGLDFLPAAINSIVVGFVMRGKRKYSLRKIRRIFLENGFKITKEKTPLLNTYHHFFVLEK